MLTRCPECKTENYYTHVLPEVCAWCPYEAPETEKNKLYRDKLMKGVEDVKQAIKLECSPKEN